MDYMIFNVLTETDTVRESALKAESLRKKIPYRTGKSNLSQRHTGSTLYQLERRSHP